MKSEERKDSLSITTTVANKAIFFPEGSVVDYF
jgi:hypothetical protein